MRGDDIGILFYICAFSLYFNVCRHDSTELPVWTSSSYDYDFPFYCSNLGDKMFSIDYFILCFIMDDCSSFTFLFYIVQISQNLLTLCE